MPLPRRAIVPVAAWVVLLVSVSLLEAQTDLRYRPKAGETLHYELRITQKTTTKTKDKEISNVHQQVIDMAWLIQSVDAKGNAKVQLKFDRAKISANSPTESIEAASDPKEEPEKEPAKSMSAMAHALVRFAGSFTLSPRGEVSDVVIPPSVLKEMKAVPGAEMFAAGWTEENLQRTLKDSLLLLPADPVTKGKTWKTDIQGQSPLGKISGTMEYTYDGTAAHDGRKAEKFTVKPKLKIEPDPKAEVPITIKEYGSDGTAYFDNSAGRLAAFTTVQRIEVQAEVKDMPVTQKTEVTNAFKLLISAK